MIEWKEGAVCHFAGKQWCFIDVGHEYKLRAFGGNHCGSIRYALQHEGLKINEPREGYYIPKSELDTEGKYNQAVEVFGLFGFEWLNETYEVDYGEFIRFGNLTVMPDGSLACCINRHPANLIELTFDQLMAIGELKRKMNERDAIKKGAEMYAGFIESRELDVGMIKKVAGFEDKPAKKRKSKEAYRILELMGVEWDNVKGKWFKKEWL